MEGLINTYVDARIKANLQAEIVNGIKADAAALAIERDALLREQQVLRSQLRLGALDTERSEAFAARAAAYKDKERKIVDTFHEEDAILEQLEADADAKNQTVMKWGLAQFCK